MEDVPGELSPPPHPHVETSMHVTCREGVVVPLQVHLVRLLEQGHQPGTNVRRTRQCPCQHVQDTGKVKPVKGDGRVLPFKVYDVVEGVVQSVKPYGAFVDLGDVVGLLHITQISQNRVEDVQSILKEGDKLKVGGGCPVCWSKADCIEPDSAANSVADLQEDLCLRVGECVQVMVLSHDLDRGHITLSTRKLEATPGDMLRDPQLVFDKAEEMADNFKLRILAMTQEVPETYITLLSQDAALRHE
ncbi:hypothetical protein QJQ45_025261 [Haematococcus lacustris]|nr:hypothetical protein QJQ45_025261 [Haematococcus lacustris]